MQGCRGLPRCTGYHCCQVTLAGPRWHQCHEPARISGDSSRDQEQYCDAAAYPPPSCLLACRSLCWRCSSPHRCQRSPPCRFKVCACMCVSVCLCPGGLCGWVGSENAFAAGRPPKSAAKGRGCQPRGGVHVLMVNSERNTERAERHAPPSLLTMPKGFLPPVGCSSPCGTGPAPCQSCCTCRLLTRHPRSLSLPSSLLPLSPPPNNKCSEEVARGEERQPVGCVQEGV